MEGWISIHRKIVDSDIYQMPPLYLRVFERLLIEANHQDNEIPYKKKGEKITGKKLIRRGERLTSVRDICRWVSWYERGKEVVPNPRTIQSILDWLIENNMIEIYGVKGNRTETHYKVVNYSNYQDDTDSKVTEELIESNIAEISDAQGNRKTTPRNVENYSNYHGGNDSKVTEKQQSVHTNNNDNNIYISIEQEACQNEELKKVLVNFIEFREKIGKPLDEKGIEILLKKLESIAKTDDEKIKVLEQSIFNGWQDIYPLKDIIEGKPVDKPVDKLWKPVHKSKKQNTFHNFDGKMQKYSEQELEEIAKRKLRAKREN